MLESFFHQQGYSVAKAALVDLDLSMPFMAGLFLVLFVILSKTLAEPLLQVFDRRHALTDGEKAAAVSAVKLSEARIRAYEERITEAKRHALDEQQKIRHAGQAQQQELLETVRVETAEESARGLADLRESAADATVRLEALGKELGERIATKLLGGAA